MAHRQSANASSPICSGVAVYHASGSAEITRSAGLAVWPRKNQCHHARAKPASQRSSASAIGTASMTTSRSTAPGWSIASRNAT
jgi:hypothetical protein